MNFLEVTRLGGLVVAWWVWALILWAMTASAAVLWLGARLSMKVELLAERKTDRDDLWDNGLRHDKSVTLAQTWDRSVEVLSRLGDRVRRRLAPGVRE